MEEKNQESYPLVSDPCTSLLSGKSWLLGLLSLLGLLITLLIITLILQTSISRKVFTLNPPCDPAKCSQQQYPSESGLKMKIQEILFPPRIRVIVGKVMGQPPKLKRSEPDQQWGGGPNLEFFFFLFLRLPPQKPGPGEAQISEY